MYDSSINSSYFADGFKGQISVKVSASGGARISLCWFTDESDYEHFLDLGTDMEQFNVYTYEERGCIKVLEFKNGTEIKTTPINNTLPSYYFIGIRVEKTITSLRYNFTAERTYYNVSDLAKVPDCKIAHIDPQCSIQLSGETCVMLYAEPEPVENASTFHPLILHGQKKSDERKEDISIFLWVLAGLFVFLVPLTLVCFCNIRKSCRKLFDIAKIKTPCS